MSRKLILLGIMILATSLLSLNCSRDLESKGLGFDLPDEPPVPTGLRLVVGSEIMTLSWEMPQDVSGYTYNVYYASSLDGSYTLYGSTGQMETDLVDLTDGTTFYFRVTSVDPDGVESDRSDAVAGQFGILTARINGGDEYTNSRDVTVGFLVPMTAVLVQLSEDPTFADADWETYALNKTFELSDGDGVKVVYARFQFNNGYFSDDAEPVMDSIILDTQCEIDTVYFSPSGTTFERNDLITFSIIASDPDGEAIISFPGKSSLELTYDELGSNSELSQYLYSTVYEIPANLEVFDGVVTGNFRDAAGNTADEQTAEELLNISNPPMKVTLVAVAESSTEIRLTWSESLDDDFAAYHIYRGLTSDVSNNTDPITVIDTRGETTFTDTGLTGGTTYYYVIYVYDVTGLHTASDIVSASTL